MRKQLLGVVLISSALAACGGAEAADKGPTVPAPTSSVTTSPAATSSAAVTDCGTFNLTQGEGLPDAAIRCFMAAVDARRPARLMETRPTVEGDPIPVTYLARADGRVEVITDSRQDAFGTQTINRQICLSPTPDQGQLTFAQCS